ncbi:unnamed protein product [Nippostrongylus brasiliensis]|uniref:Small hydrophilic protein n=1 Tax=Nippostrongylus brasiliensis TaxID=27835 RepID=A0A0N4Y567_NIPBR|nr:unnamed protein product [Nippostrongylus brasiliensis]
MEENCHDHKMDRWSHARKRRSRTCNRGRYGARRSGSGQDGSVAPQQMREQRQKKEDGATIMKDVPRN